MLYLIDMPPLASIPMIFPQNRTIVSPLRVRCGEISNNGAVVDGGRIRGPVIADLPLDQIRRPLLRTRSNDPEKVKALMQSIANIGLQEPIDILEVDGLYYGFSGCHRFEAHQRLGLSTIRCKIRRGTKETLRHHLR
ncbi:hypothetical protein O6H91_03G032600 [Diphasiastrum complanatum]|uniref:Uncharacterized protein n=1 Tax=Diphasiastrum complanatum TaxID=34168 RepID=A0ACC2E566_DIPCM|nr:hypothetical protein O6H91_03G032600 [Diphasiastrum complanatum]